MDGSSVNWKFYGEVVKSRKEAMYHKLIDMDSCALHVVHGSLKTAVDKNGLRIKKALEGIFHL